MSKRLFLGALLVVLAACQTVPPTRQEQQAEAGRRRAESITFASNAEQGNIERRLKLTSDASLLGYILLLNEAGQPIAYYGVEGKVTSSTKRLTPIDKADDSGYNGTVVTQSPSDEGTYGSSDPCVYFWTTSGQYVQWNGRYLYSDQPIRLRVQPIVISVK